MEDIITPDLWQNILTRVMLFLPRFFTSLVILLLFWLGGMLLKQIVHRVGVRRNLDRDVLSLLEQALLFTILAFGLVTALGTVGIEVTALVAGLGLTGFALGFALKDIISNFLAGILILTYHPFQRGDQIAVADSQGRVTAIDLRYTVLDGGENTILIPNSQLFTNTINVAKPPREVGQAN